MSLPRSIQVTGTEVTAHTGEGDLNVFRLSLADSAARSPRKDPDDYLRWLGQRYVHPDGFGNARALLRSDSRTVFLDGPRGSGRAAAARMLLWELRADTASRYELQLEGGEDQPLLNLEQIGDRDGLWLNLSDTGEQQWTQAHAALSSLRDRVLEHSGWLVVVLPEDTDLDPPLDPFRARIGRPAAEEVFLRHLRLAGLPQPDDPAEVAFLARPRSPGEIADYVRRIERARDESPGTGGLADWLSAADDVSSGRDLEEVAKHLDTLGQGSQRALLLATAMLNGAHADGVSGAADTLLSQLGDPDQTPLLQLPALDKRFDDIRAERDPSGRVTFARPGYDAAVRQYAWIQWPRLREPMRDWLAEIVDSDDLTRDNRDQLLTRYLDQCLKIGSASLWAPLVVEWTKHPARHRAEAAALVLLYGLRDEENGRAFRRQIYWWSRDAQISRQLAEVIIAACRDEMARSHPEEALVRLHHLARRERQTTARQALADLVNGDRWLLRLMLSRLTGNRSARIRRADAELFLEFTRPEMLPGMLIGEATVRGHLVTGWRLAFEELTPVMWEERAAEWLHHAGTDTTYQEEFLDVLVEGGRSRTDALARLFVITMRDTRIPTATRELLVRKIDAVQGLQLEEPS